MNIQVTSESFVRKLQVSVPADVVRSELDKAFAQVGRTAHLRGFRKGKAPAKVLEARFGERVRVDVANVLVQRGYTAALDEHNIEPVSRPALVERGEIESDAAFTFTINVDVKPVLDTAEYKGLSVYWPPFEVTDADVDAAVESRRQQQTRRVSVEDRPVAVGDHVQVELNIFDGDDEVVTEPGTLIRTEGDAWFAGIEGMLEGMKLGAKKTKTITFSDDARTEAVAGKKLKVKAKVLAIQADEVPELTDELATEMGFEGGVDAMRASLQTDLSSAREDASRTQARANLLSALIAANAFDVPEGMVESNLQLLVEELKMQAVYRGQDPKNLRFNDAQIADLRNRASFAAKGAILLEYIWTTESISVTDADCDARIEELASQRGQTVEAIRGYFQGDAMEDLRQRILEEKCLDWLLEQAAVTHEAPAAEEATEAAAAPKAKKKAAPKAKKKAAPKAKKEAAPAASASGDLSGKTVKELKAMAKEAGVKGYSSMKKGDLIAALS